MGKKEKKIITLSEVDHKLQFINVMAVIRDITPIISRSKLTKIELSLLDETVKDAGFNVKLNLESEMLNHFLNVAKRGFIVQLNDIKVTKNEGNVYGEVQEEEEITLYNDNHHVHKWYPGEKPTTVTDTFKLKILSMVKWKKANFKDVEVIQKNSEDNSKTRRNALNSDGKNQPSKSLNKNNTPVSNSRAQKITEKSQQVIDNLLSKENKVKGTTSRRSKLDSTPINEPTNRLRVKKTLMSSEETESPSTSSSSNSSSPARVTRTTDASNPNKSSSLSSLHKTMRSRLNKSVSLSRLNTSKSQTNLDDSKVSSGRKKVTKVVEAKGGLGVNKKLISAEETESPSTSSSSISSSPSRATRTTDASNLNKSVSLSRLNTSKSQTNLDDSKVTSGRKKVTKVVEAKGGLGVNKKFISAEEAESSSTNSSKTSISSSPSRVTRATGASNLNKSTSLSSLHKTMRSRTPNNSSSPTRLNKSVSLSRLNKSEPQTNLDDSKASSGRKKVTKGVEAKGEKSESESIRSSRSISKSKINKNTLSSSDSDSDEMSSEESNSEMSPVNRKPALNKNKNVSVVNTSRKLSRNKTADCTEVKTDPANKERSNCFDSKSEKVIPVSRSSQNNKRDCVSRDTEKNIAAVKTNENKINRNKNYVAGVTDEVETKEANNLDSSFKRITKGKGKEADTKSINEEKLSTFETVKKIRQLIKDKTDGSPSLGKRNSPIINDSNCSFPNTTSRLSKSEDNTNNEFKRRKRVLVDETEVNNELGKNIHNRNSITRKKGADSETDSPTRKKRCLTYESGHLSDTSSEASPKSKRKTGVLRNPPLNSSDSNLSQSSNPSVNRISGSRESYCVQKRDFNQTDTSTELVSVSSKKLKLDKAVANKSEGSRPSPENDLSNSDNEQTRKSTKASETVSKRKSNRNNNEDVDSIGLSNKNGPDLKTNQNENRIVEKNQVPIKTTRPDKEVITLPKTRKQVLETSELNEDILNKQTRKTANCINNTVKNNRESGKYGIYETYLRPLTKKLNFTSVECINDISLCDLEEVYVPDKFDLQCKVVSQFVLVEEGIQVVRVLDGTVCKCDTLKIPLGDSWDIISKQILDNPIIEEKSQYIDIIIFNYFRLDYPIKSDKFYRINNVMAVKFQLKRDPRQGKKSNREFFYCVEGQNANIKKMSYQQFKEIQERIANEPQKSNFTATISHKTIAEKPASDLPDFKLPVSPKMDGKKNLLSGKKIPVKTKPVEEESLSGLKLKTRKQSDPNLDIDPEVTSPRGRSPAEDKTKKENLRNNSETWKGKANTDGNLVKINTTNSSDETLMGETPPLLRELHEIMYEESELGLPVTISEDVHLKNSGSEVTFSQFCEGAKLKGNNFRTSTQNVDVDVQKIGSPNDVLVTNKGVILSEDTSKMEPLVYCPSGSSASSAICGSPDKLKTPRDFQDSQQFSASVIVGPQVKTISDLKPSNLESKKVINDDTSDLSYSSSVRILSSSGSVEVDLKDLGSKDAITRGTTKVTAVKLTVSSEIKDLLRDMQNEVSLSTSKSPVLLKDKKSGKVVESVCVANDDIAVISDSSDASIIAAANNTPIKPMSTFNASANVNDERAKLIPDRCFYKSQTTAPMLTEHELNEIYDDENSPVKYFSYCHNRDLPLLTLDVVEKIKNSNSLAMTVTFVSITPAFTDSWKERCIKAQCPSCDKLYDVFNAANNQNNENASATAAISVGSHIVCPDSQCCNQILETPEFHFSVEFMLEDGTPLSALLGGEHAEDVFGCSAPEAMRNESALSRVAEIVENISKCIAEKRPTKVVVKRKDICNVESGPLFLSHVGV